MISLLKTYAKQLISFSFALAFLASCQTQIGNRLGGDVNLNDPLPVALLVPDGGENAALNAMGGSMRAAANMAWADLSGADSVNLRMYSTSGNPELAAIAAQQAIADGAKLIIGPLKSAEAVAVASVAGDVPVFSFTNNADIAKNNIYAIGTTFFTLSERMMRFAATNGQRNIAVATPEGLSGDQAYRGVYDAIVNNGLNYAGGLTYPLSIEGINSVVPSLVKKLNDEQADSIVFTDTPSGGLSYISEALRGVGVSTNNYKFYGTAKWDSVPEILSLPSLQGGYFVAPDPTRQAGFDSRYFERYGTMPNELAPLAYDGVAAAIGLMRAARANGEISPLSNQLIYSTLFAGATGSWKMTNSNFADRELSVMQVSGGSAVQVALPEMSY